MIRMLKIKTNVREFYIREKFEILVLNKMKKEKAKKLKKGDFIFQNERILRVEKSGIPAMQNEEGFQTNTISDFVKEMNLKYKDSLWKLNKEKKLMDKYNIIRVELFMAGVLITNGFLDRMYLSGETLEEDLPLFYVENEISKIDFSGIKFLRNNSFEYVSENEV